MVRLLGSWAEHAECAKPSAPPGDDFYPGEGKTQFDSTDWPTGALRTCGRCPVRDECLEFALQNKEPGVWGGTTEPERKMMLAKRKAAAA